MRQKWLHKAEPWVDPDTGEILQRAACPPNDRHANLQATWATTTCPRCWAQRAIRESLGPLSLAVVILREVAGINIVPPPPKR